MSEKHLEAIKPSPNFEYVKKQACRVTREANIRANSIGKLEEIAQCKYSPVNPQRRSPCPSNIILYTPYE